MFSDQQRDVIRAYCNGESIAVNSVAGSGKTTTAVGAVNNAGKTAAADTLSVAFNKRNADDLAARMPAGVTSKTMNSLGNTAWKNHLGKWPKLEINKLWTLLQVPAVHVPLRNGPKGLPIGVQVVGRPGDDARVLACAHWVEKNLKQT